MGGERPRGQKIGVRVLVCPQPVPAMSRPPPPRASGFLCQVAAPLCSPGECYGLQAFLVVPIHSAQHPAAITPRTSVSQPAKEQDGRFPRAMPWQPGPHRLPFSSFVTKLQCECGQKPSSEL